MSNTDGKIDLKVSKIDIEASCPHCLLLFFPFIPADLLINPGILLGWGRALGTPMLLK